MKRWSTLFCGVVLAMACAAVANAQARFPVAGRPIN